MTPSPPGSADDIPGRDEADPRYARQARFAPLGIDGQSRLSCSTALIVGIGALGTHLAQSLWRAGIAHLTLVDRDVVELDNLPRQTLFDERDAQEQEPKATAAARALRTVRSDGTLEPIVADFDAEVFAALERRPAVILDGTDNFASRYLLNDLAIREDLPWIYGGVVGAHGRAAVVSPGSTPCLRCLMPTAPAAGEIGTCETEGVLEPAVAAVAAFQAVEALKILSGRLSAITRGLYEFDAWNGRYTVRMRDSKPDPACRSCGTRELPALSIGADEVVALCGRDAVQVRPRSDSSIDLDVVASRLAGAVSDLERTPHGLRFRIPECRFSVFSGGRALLFGVRDPLRAKALYDRWIGAR